LIARFGTPSAALAAVPDLARRGGGTSPRLFGRDDAEREIARVEKHGAKFLALGQGLYPRLLAELEDAPPLLTAKGNLNLLDKMGTAIVGARNASAAACRFARGLAYDLGQNDLVVVSGLARGIDSAAHDGALETGTIGIVAGGVDVFYPPENESRQKALYERGLVIAEMPPGTEPRARHFPYRNRIIAGISAGTVGIGGIAYGVLAAVGIWFAKQADELRRPISPARAFELFHQHAWIGTAILFGLVLGFWW